jgi:thioredoxin reductase (NADPH)
VRADITIAACGAAFLAAGALLLGEHPAVAPGAVSKTHATLSGACRACHQPFHSARASCTTCHGALSPKNAHAKEALTCASCHEEHRGAQVTMKSGATRDCISCHTRHNALDELDIQDGEVRAKLHLRGEMRSDETATLPRDVLARIGGFAVTPWLIGFLFLGSGGYVLALRRTWVVADDEDRDRADPDAAPQRVSEVPALSPSYESSIPGLYIVGELAGVPLINRAMKSGFDAIDFIQNRLQMDGGSVPDGVVDVLIAGAGPAGLGAATRAKSKGLSYLLLEKVTPAATIAGYPRAKVVQSAPIDIPEYGTFFQETDETKEALTRRWEDIVARVGLSVNEREEVVAIEREPTGALLTKAQSGKVYRSRTIVLAIGVRGTPRRLGVPGETPERVAYALVDAQEFRERKLLVGGGGNAACEAALALSEPSLLNQVTLSHRGPVLKDVTSQNSQAIDVALREGRLAVEPDSGVKEIRAGSVTLKTPSGEKEIPNDLVFAMIGAELPTKFLRAIGVKLVRKGGL